MTRSQTAVVAAVAASLLTVTGVAGAVGLRGHAPPHHVAAPAAPRPATSAATRSDQRIALPRLRRLTAPDAIATLPRTATPGQLRALRHLDGVRAVAVADSGFVHYGGARLRVLGAEAVPLRPFTPRFTATSAALWQSVARGEITVDYSLAGRLQQLLGAIVPAASGSATASLRLGAFASLGLGRTQAVVDRGVAASLHLARDRVVIVSAPHLSSWTLRTDLRAVFGSRTRVSVVRPQLVHFVISAYARAMIPPAYLRLYRAAASTCRGLPWTVLAAIGTVETGNGRNTATSSKGAMGPMQFLPSTFVAYAVDGDGDGVANIQDPADAIYSAARYLCLWGAGLGGQSLYAAIYAYNHADWYVREVLALAVAYA